MNMVKTATGFLLAICILVLPLQEALAHGGGLNSDGCHRETATGGYHCHRDGEDDDVDWETIGAVAGGLVLLWLLVEWLDNDTSPAFGLRMVPGSAAEDAPRLAAEYRLNNFQHVGVRASMPLAADESEGALAYWRVNF